VGSFGKVFVATYKQTILPERRDEIFNLVVKRVGGISDDYFSGRRKSLDPSLGMLEDQLIALNHRHLIKVFAIVDGNKIVMPRAPFGPLDEYLRQSGQDLNCHNLVYVSSQVASGMAALEKAAIVHGRLKARNVLVNEISRCKKWIHVKISDFGIPYSQSEPIPPRLPWASPEEIKCIVSSAKETFNTSDGVTDENNNNNIEEESKDKNENAKQPSFTPTLSSDCWAFGIVLHEVFTMGQRPYNGLNLVSLCRWVPEGHRMSQAFNVPNGVYNLMVKCWHPAMLKRPPMAYLDRTLNRKYKEITPDFQCKNCLDKSVIGGHNARNV